MTCLEAQSNIMAFIDKKLPDSKVNDFVRHVKNCPNCSEELEIYYTLIVGTRQLDNNEELSKDFKKDLNLELDRLSSKVRKVKRFKVSTFGIICIAVITLFGLFYSTCLNKVYNIEQNRIKTMQGDSYFYDTFGDYIILNDKLMVKEGFTEPEHYNNFKSEKSELYRKIKLYNYSHEDGEEDNE